MKQKKSISAVKRGLNRSSHPSQLSNLEVSMAVNVNTNSEIGDSLNYQLEPSNSLGVEQNEGYKVIGFKNDLLKERTYYFLTNTEETLITGEHYKRSSIGYVDYSKVLNNDFNNTYQLENCSECKQQNNLNTPLELQVQTPSQNYVELVHDRCIAVVDLEDKGLNFNINSPIKKIEIKQEKFGTNLYWNDWRNYFRYLQVGKIEEAIDKSTFDYLHTLDIACKDPIATLCLDVSKLLVAPLYTRLEIEADKVEIGGNLKMGTYEFYPAYCDINANSISDYSTPTNPISIWDENNYIQNQTETDEFTNYAIKLKIKNLDIKRFKYYKVAVVERNNVNSTQSVFLVGVFPTTDDTVSYTHSSSSNDDLYLTRGNVEINKRLTFQELLAKKPRYKRMKGTMVTDNRLIGYGLEEEAPINLQPVVNLFSGLLKFQTGVAKEDLYKSPIATSKYKQYPRNEVQPVALRLLYDDGGYSSNFPFIGRPSTEYDREIIGKTNPNNASLLDGGGNCTSTERTRRWQMFNTAEEIESEICFDLEAGAIELPAVTTEKICVTDLSELPIPIFIPAGTHLIESLTEPYYDLETYINDPLTPNILEIESFLDPNLYTTCVPYYNPSSCTAPVLIVNSSVVLISEVIGETNIIEYKALMSEYVRTTPPKYCTLFNREGASFERDTAFEELYSACYVSSLTGIPGNITTNYSKIPVFIRNTDLTNEVCIYAEDIPIIDNLSQSFSSVVLNYQASENQADLITDNNLFITPVVASGFLSRVHNKAKFFKIEKKGRDKILFEITKIKGDCPSSVSEKTDLFAIFSNREIRYNMYSNCSGSLHLGGEIVDLNNGLLKELDVTLFPNTFYVVIDTKIITQQNVALTCPTTNQRIVHYIVPPCEGCFGVYQREREPKAIRVSWEKIKIRKEMTYNITCRSSLPKVNDCDPRAYKKYKPAYWQSTDRYSNNKELYDSSKLKISISGLNLLEKNDINDFLSYYSQANLIKLTAKNPKYNFIVGQQYFILQKSDEPFLNQIVNKIFTASVAQNISWTDSLVYLVPTLNDNILLNTEETYFLCKPIRHPKSPDNTVAPYIIDNSAFPKSADSIIFPLGLNFDSKIVRAIINTAFENNYITEKQKNKIIGWEVLKGDNTTNKSINSSGILIDVNKYRKNNQDIHFSNFPFNDLGDNKFIVDDEGNLIKHVYDGSKNNNFTYISPDMLLTRPNIPSEVVLQGYLQGIADVSFSDVKDHPQYTILGKSTYNTANSLASAEVALEIVLNLSNISKEIFVGVSTNIGAIIAAAVYGAAAAAQSYIKKGKYRYDWLKIFKDLGRTNNFASFQHGVAKHNKLLRIDRNDNNYVRRLSLKKQLKKNNYRFLDENSGEEIRLNHFKREDSTFLGLGKHFINYPSEYKNFDNNKVNSKSSNFISSKVGCENKSRNIRDVANPYVHLRNYIPDQWGTLDSIKWLTTNYIFNINDNTLCKPIFGGSQTISRFSWRVKVPFFERDSITNPNKTQFMYSNASNVANTRFYCDYETGDDAIFRYNGIPFPDIKSNYNFDCTSGKNDFYLKAPSKFYLFTHGVIDFLVESEINCNFRYGRKDPKDQFYNGQDLGEWLQEVNLPMSEPNTFFYNNAYSKPVSNTPFNYLDRTYNKEEMLKKVMMPNAWIWSEKDNSENDGVDSWLISKPLNLKEEKTNNGKLIDLTSIESGQFLARYENEYSLYNQPNPYADVINAQNKELGTGILYNKPMTQKSTNLGFAGTQNSEIISTPFGHFWCDAKRGKIFKVDQNGQGLEVISENIDGKPSGMTPWFREHLPFKILKYLPNVDIDNKFKGIGLNMWWDDRENRLFVTKRDWIPKNSTLYTVNENGVIFNGLKEVFFNDTEFINVSWTIAYKPTEGTWNSYFSFYPDYSPFHNNFFQTGYNWGVDKGTVWNHLLNRSSFSVFQGKKHTPILEFAVASENVNKILNSVALNLEAHYYLNDWESTTDKDKSFKNMFIYNGTNNTGMLELIPQKSLNDIRKYPITEGNIQKILYTAVEDKQNVNYLFNRVVNEQNNIPMFVTDKNNIFKTINNSAVNFSPRRVLERLKGEYFLIHLEGMQDSRFNLILKNTENNETIYQ